MESAADYRSVAEYARLDEERLVRVLLHSDDSWAAACAMEALDRGDNQFSADEFEAAIREALPEEDVALPVK
ncbi:MAG: hypothetical protein SV186_04890 [Candidatus Nanohaloarchaea archaeon]|nr:hypothetical protein [Candidatus Nanohaloarchaea archaeon]